MAFYKSLRKGYHIIRTLPFGAVDMGAKPGDRWLTEISKRKQPEEEEGKPVEGDEDGPDSSDVDMDEEQKDDAADTDDSEGSSSPEPCARQTLKAPADPYTGHLERQREARCALHALNHALGRPFANDEDMEFAVENVLQTAKHEGSQEKRSDHVAPNGWYSSEVIAAALATTSMRRAGKVEYKMLLRPLSEFGGNREISMAPACVILSLGL